MSKMSKTKLNTVAPDILFDKYGSDTVHTYILSMAPPDRDVIYSERNVVGINRFLNRLWSTVTDALPRLDGEEAGPAEADEALRRKTHQVIGTVTAAFERTFHFNVAIARVMELVNATREADAAGAAALREALETTVRLIAPFAPHIAEELWSRLGHAETVFRSGWPVYDEDAATEDEVELVVQVNGKVRAKVTAPRDADETAVREQALAEPRVAAFVAGKTVRKVIVVPNRIVNIVAN